MGVLLGYGVLFELILGDAIRQGRLKPWLLSTNITGFIDRGTTYRAESCTAARCEYAERTLTHTHSWIHLLVLGVAVVLLSLLVFRRRDVT